MLKQLFSFFLKKGRILNRNCKEVSKRGLGKMGKSCPVFKKSPWRQEKLKVLKKRARFAQIAH
jgi:hypothetical protein